MNFGTPRRIGGGIYCFAANENATKKYPLFRHVTQEEALARALRNIEQDLAGEFAGAVRRIGE
jgi:hypothetical protein